MAKLIQVDFVPKEMVSYCKETQTPTEALAHTDQKAGNSPLMWCLYSCSPLLKLIYSDPRLCLDEEEDEEISAPPLTEDTQDEKNEQSEQQEEGEDSELCRRTEKICCSPELDNFQFDQV